MKVGTAETLREGLMWSDVVELCKPRITLMVLITTAAGAYLATPGAFSPLLIVGTLVATAVLASAASALNQVLEVRTDALMVRTSGRPLAAGRMDRGTVISASLAATAASLLYLALRVNLLTALLGAATWAAYLFVYTPMKRLTPLSTLVGAVPGALPPLMGWTAIAGELEAGAWILFGVLFLWQVPHFLAIAWMYREDYARGGIPVLAVIDRGGRWTAGSMVLFALATLIVSLLPPALGGGVFFSVAAAALGGAFVVATLSFVWRRSKQSARTVLLASVLYLPAILVIMVWSYLPLG